MPVASSFVTKVIVVIVVLAGLTLKDLMHVEVSQVDENQGSGSETKKSGSASGYYDYYQYDSFLAQNGTAEAGDDGFDKCMEEIGIRDDHGEDAPADVPCGRWKCAFTSRRNLKRGYLIAPNIRTNGKADSPHLYETMSKGYQLALHFETMFGSQNFKHLFEGPPAVFDRPNGCLIDYYFNPEADTGQYVVQPIKVMAEDRRVEFKFNEDTDLRGQIHDVIDLIQRESRPGDYPVVLERVERQFDIAAQILREFPIYARDYQLFVGGDGNVYHIDLDRVYMYPGLFRNNSKTGEEKSARYQSILSNVQIVLKIYKKELRSALLS